MPTFATTSSRWAALQSRDPKATNAFIYSVTTTKIYCRPTCPSRLARRANIIFHKNAAEAQADGFRPCKRCRPEVTENDGDSQKDAVEQACSILKKELDDGIKLPIKALASKVGLTECHFCRVFKKITGVTVGQYRLQLRSQRTSSEARTSPKNATRTFDDVATPSAGSDYLATPDDFDFSATLHNFSQADIDSFTNFHDIMTTYGSSGLRPCESEMLDMDQSILYEQPYSGMGDAMFDFVDFENQTIP